MSKSRVERAATGKKDRLWDHAVIPYEINSTFSGMLPLSKDSYGFDMDDEDASPYRLISSAKYSVLGGLKSYHCQDGMP